MNYQIINTKYNRSWFIGMIFLLVIVNLVFATYFIEDAYPSHNTVSNLVMASAPMHGMGLPYKEYWDIYPPGIFIFLTPFEFFFHGQTIVFKIVHILFSICIGLIVLKFLVHLFRNHVAPVFPVMVFFLLYLLMSNYYYCILFHNAFLALFLSMCGLYLLTFAKKNWAKYFLSSLLLAFSASMKETFLFTVFLPVLYVVSRYLWREHRSYSQFFKNLRLIASGILIVLLGNYLYLNLLGITKSYGEVSDFKSQLIQGNSFVDLFNNLNPFNFYDFSLRFKELSDAFFRHSYGFIYCLYLFVFLFFIIPIKLTKIDGQWKFLWKKWSHDKGIAIIVCGFCLLNFEGFQLLKKYQPNYTLQMVPSLLLAFAFLFQITSERLQSYLIKMQFTENRKKIVTCGLFFCFAWALFPKFTNFSFMKSLSLHQYVTGLSLEKPSVLLPPKVKQAMGNDQRIFYIYGWGTPYFYYFAKVKPFSRFFILHPNILGEEQINELVQQFKTELPKVVLYCEYGADMNTVEFENNTIQFKKILETCYEFYPSHVYQGFHSNGYYLLKDDSYFKLHLKDFIASKYL